MPLLGRNRKKPNTSANTVPPVTVQPSRRQRNYIDIISDVTRMPQMTDPRTLGPTFHTADQMDQRLYIGTGFDGRNSFDADPATATPVTPGGGAAPGFATACRTRRHEDGTCDIVRLDATDDGWIDYGGPTPSDFKVVNW